MALFWATGRCISLALPSSVMGLLHLCAGDLFRSRLTGPGSVLWSLAPTTRTLTLSLRLWTPSQLPSALLGWAGAGTGQPSSCSGQYPTLIRQYGTEHPTRHMLLPKPSQPNFPVSSCSKQPQIQKLHPTEFFSCSSEGQKPKTKV